MKQESYHLNTGDKTILFARSWAPGQKSGKTILLIHGLGENCDRYEHWARLFVENGFNFVAFDLRGHGRSTGKKGHAKSVEVLLDDIDFMMGKVKEWFPENKLVLYGHSMGGNLALNHIIRRNRPVDALVVTSPWLKLTKEPSPALISLASIMSKILPSVTISNGLSPEDLSHDPEVGKKYVSDPLNHDKISFRLFTEIHNAGYHALRNVYKINYPFLLMHGTDDRITSPKASENYVMNTTSRTHLKLWEGQNHELHNEFIYKEVFAYILDWLNKQIT